MPQDKKDGNGDGSSGPSSDSRLKNTLIFSRYHMNAASKRMLKRYRTEVAASSASLVSTLVTVSEEAVTCYISEADSPNSFHWTRSSLACKRKTTASLYDCRALLTVLLQVRLSPNNMGMCGSYL